MVCKLFNLIQPEYAVFGEKDFQQLQVIRRMVDDLNLPVSIVGVPTCRELDGLAMSSRNRYLSEEERARAPYLHAVLESLALHILDGEQDYQGMEQEALDALAAEGFQPDYVEVLQQKGLQPPEADTAAEQLVVLAAAWLGEARLIDNLMLDRLGQDNPLSRGRVSRSG